MSEDRPATLEHDLLQALAGAALLRDRLAEAGDLDGTRLALQTGTALNRVFAALSLDLPSGTAQLVVRNGGLPAPGFA